MICHVLSCFAASPAGRAAAKRPGTPPLRNSLPCHFPCQGHAARPLEETAGRQRPTATSRRSSSRSTALSTRTRRFCRFARPTEQRSRPVPLDNHQYAAPDSRSSQVNDNAAPVPIGYMSGCSSTISEIPLSTASAFVNPRSEGLSNPSSTAAAGQSASSAKASFSHALSAPLRRGGAAGGRMDERRGVIVREI